MARGEETSAEADASEPSMGLAGQKVGIRVILSDPAVRTVMLIVVVIMMGFGIIAPILPLYARSFGVGYDAAGLLISAFAMARLIFDLIAGPIVDRWGERLTATAGVLFLGVSSILTAKAPNFPLAVFFRGVGGAGSSVMFAAMYSYLLKVVPKDRMARTLGIFFGSFNIGFIAGGPAGGLIAQHYGLASPLLFYAALCFLTGGLYLRYLPDPNHSAQASVDAFRGGEASGARLSTWTTIKELLAIRGFVTAIVANLAFFWVIAGAYDTLVPLFGREHLGMSTVGIGAGLAATIAGEFLVLYPAGTAADRFGRKPLMVPALIWLAVAIAAVGWAGSPGFFILLLGVVGFGSGSVAVSPTAILSDVVPDGRSGTAVGVFRFCGDLGFVLGPLVAGVTASSLGFKGAFGVVAIPVLVALVFVLRTPETLRPGEAAPPRTVP